MSGFNEWVLFRQLFAAQTSQKSDLRSPIDEILAPAVDAGIAAAFIHLRQTGGVIVAVWAQAGEAVDAVDTCASVVTGVDGAFIDVDVTHCS